MAAMDIAGDEGDLESLKLVCSSHCSCFFFTCDQQKRDINITFSAMLVV